MTALVRPGQDLVGFIDAFRQTLGPSELSNARETAHSEGDSGYKGPAATAIAGAVLGNRAVIHAGKLIHFLG